MLNQRHLHLLHHGKDTSLSSRTDLLYAAVNITTIAQLNTGTRWQAASANIGIMQPHCSATQSSRNTPYDTHLVSLHYAANATLTLPIMVKRNPLHRCTRASSISAPSTWPAHTCLFRHSDGKITSSMAHALPIQLPSYPFPVRYCRSHANAN